MAHDRFTHRFSRTGKDVHGTERSIFARGVIPQQPVGEIGLVTLQGRELAPYSDRNLYTKAVRRFADAVPSQHQPAAAGSYGVKLLVAFLAMRDAARSATRCQVNDGGM